MSAIQDMIEAAEWMMRDYQDLVPLETRPCANWKDRVKAVREAIQALQSLEGEASIKLHWDANERLLSIADYRETFPTEDSHTFLAYTTPQPPDLPDERKRYSDSPYEGGYADGWNSCRKAIIAAAQQEDKS